MVKVTVFPISDMLVSVDEENSKKRKLTEENNNDNVLPTRHDLLSTRPRLTISRHPTFLPFQDDLYTTEQLAMNRMGFRYTPAGVAPLGSIVPCRTIESAPQSYRISWEDRSPFLKVSTDGLRLAGEKGFRSARCNAPIREGHWYLEVKVERGGGDLSGDLQEGSHVRLGWGRREAPLNGPAGLDGYSYGVRDKTGEKVTLSRPRPYGRPFGSGDVIGMYISLPPRRQPNKNDPHDPAHLKRERIPIEFKGQEYFESVEYPQAKEMIALMDYSGKSANTSSLPSSSKKSATVKNLPERGRTTKPVPQPAPPRVLPTIPESYVAFFINGECQGIAFQELYDYLPLRTTQASRKVKEKKRLREGGLEHKENPFDDGALGYYPFISLFNHARVRVNPGPQFDFPPPPDVDSILKQTATGPEKPQTWRPVCERYTEYMAEQCALDAEEEEEAKAALAQQAKEEQMEMDKDALRRKRRREAEARRRAKKAAEARKESTVSEDVPRKAGPLSIIVDPPDRAYSPTPTVTSSVDINSTQDVYNSDNDDNEAEFLDAAGIGTYLEPDRMDTDLPLVQRELIEVRSV